MSRKVRKNKRQAPRYIRQATQPYHGKGENKIKVPENPWRRTGGSLVDGVDDYLIQVKVKKGKGKLHPIGPFRATEAEAWARLDQAQEKMGESKALVLLVRNHERAVTEAPSPYRKFPPSFVEVKRLEGSER